MRNLRIKPNAGGRGSIWKMSAANNNNSNTNADDNVVRLFKNAQLFDDKRLKMNSGAVGNKLNNTQ